MLVGFGLDEQLREPVEVHCYYTTGFLITLRRAPSPALDALRHAGSVHPQLESDPIRRAAPVDQLALYPVLRTCPGAGPTAGCTRAAGAARGRRPRLPEITAIRGRAAVIRRTLTPGRDLAARTPLIQSLPGVTSETQLYAEDINDELQQIVADSTADRGAMCRPAGPARLARKQAPSVREPSARGCGHHLPAHLLPGPPSGTELRRAHRQHRKGMAGVLVLGVGLSVACVAVIVFMLSRRSWK